MSHFSQWLHSGLPIGHWYERVDWLLCGFLLMVNFNGFHPACAVLGGWVFFTPWYTDIVCVNVYSASCSALKHSEQVFSGSYFNLQVGQLPVLTELFFCATVTSLLAVSTGLSRMFQRQYFLSLIKLLLKGRSEIWSSSFGESSWKTQARGVFAVLHFVEIPSLWRGSWILVEMRHFPGSIHSWLFPSRGGGYG